MCCCSSTSHFRTHQSKSLPTLALTVSLCLAVMLLVQTRGFKSSDWGSSTFFKSVSSSCAFVAFFWEEEEEKKKPRWQRKSVPHKTPASVCPSIQNQVYAHVYVYVAKRIRVTARGESLTLVIFCSSSARLRRVWFCLMSSSNFLMCCLKWLAWAFRFSFSFRKWLRGGTAKESF